MNIKAMLAAIEQHFAKHRQVGHTTTMLQGVERTRACIVVAANAQHKYQLQAVVPPTCVVKNILSHAETWLGLPPLPTVFDNYTIYELCSNALRAMEDQERQCAQIDRELQTTQLALEHCNNEVVTRNERIAKLEAQIAEMTQIATTP